MARVEQSKKWFKADNDDLLNGIEEAMGSIESAMESLRGYEEFSDFFDTLDALMDDMEPEHERYDAIATREYAEEIEALNRDYLRSVL